MTRREALIACIEPTAAMLDRLMRAKATRQRFRARGKRTCRLAPSSSDILSEKHGYENSGLRSIESAQRRRTEKRPGRVNDLAFRLKFPVGGEPGEDYLEYGGGAGGRRLLFLRASTQAQHAGRNGHDHDRF